MEMELKDVVQPIFDHVLFASSVTFNNQNSIIMSMTVPIYQLLCLLHDNRIFAFKRKEASNNLSSSSDEQNVLLNLLTTPKYRAMGSMYLFFRLLDDAFLLSIIILSILHGGFIWPTAAQVTLYSVISLEVFYDVLMYNHKYWFLQRLSIYIGLTLYIAYFSIVAWKYFNGDYKPFDLKVVLIILITRFVSFLIEECVDIAIDGELHNDLLKLQDHRSQEQRVDLEQNLGRNILNPDPNVSQNKQDEQVEEEPLLGKKISSLFSLSEIKKYMDVSRNVKMPPNVDYVGSFFAWGPNSVFTEGVWTKDRFHPRLFHLLCAVPYVCTAIISSILIILCFFAFLIAILLFFICYLPCACCFCTFNLRTMKTRLKSSHLWKELTHF